MAGDSRGPSPEVLGRAGRIRMLLLDSDGVLTDGLLHMGPDGFDARSFHVRDGHGIRMGQQAGLTFGIVSGRTCRAVADRASELSIEELHQGVRDKLACVDDIVRRHELTREAVCFVGDDLVDVPVMRRVGLAAAPLDATAEARDVAHYVTKSGGGHGAVREVVDLVLRASGKWNRATDRFLK
jgi:3-deoxy-D-manno-octulosonate 8-phosphate phosphatase (KDO 8-P phosphatase)